MPFTGAALCNVFLVGTTAQILEAQARINRISQQPLW
jgi:hypothetical protein